MLVLVIVVRRETGEVSWMREPHGEGLATRADPESCGVTREGGVEALAGAHAESGIEPRKTNFWVLTL
jgi:hypothetical protein